MDIIASRSNLYVFTLFEYIYMIGNEICTSNFGAFLSFHFCYESRRVLQYTVRSRMACNTAGVVLTTGYYIILGVVNAAFFLCSDGIEGLVVERFL